MSKVCSKCGEEKDEANFEEGRLQCFGCRALYKKEHSHERKQRLLSGEISRPPSRCCLRCGETKPAAKFRFATNCSGGLKSTCYECTLWADREYKYGLSEDELRYILASQDGRCAGCETTLNVEYGADSATDMGCVDHCHDTNIVRGWLCLMCNSSLGKARNSVFILTRLADYQSAFESRTGVARPDNATSTLLSDFAYTSDG